MEIEDILEKEKQLLSIISTLKSEKFLETVFKLYSVKKILSEFKPGSDISLEEILICVEDFPVPYSDSQMIRMIESTGILEPIDQQSYRIMSHISSSKLMGEHLKVKVVDIPVEEYKKGLEIFETKKADEGLQLIGIDHCIVSMQNTISWAFEIISNCIDHAMKGMPVFWMCKENEHVAIGDIPGSFAAVDSILLILEPAYFGFCPPLCALNKIKKLEKFFDLVLSYQNKQGGWNDGGFYVEKDDDFPASNVPTVDSTANAVFMLTMLPEFNECLESKGCKPIKTMQALEYPISSGVKFLLRMQLSTGGWGIYRYEQDRFIVPPRDYSSMLAISALSQAKLIGSVLEEDVLCELESATNRYIKFVESVANKRGGTIFWSSNLSERAPETKESPYATARVSKGLIDLALASPQHRMDLEELVNGAILYIIERWEPNPRNQAIMQFRVPTKDGPFESFMRWEPPADPIVVSTLLGYSAKFNHKLDPRVIEKIHNSILHIVSSQIHGHWADLLLKEAKAFPSNTHYFHKAILAYLSYSLNNLYSITKLSKRSS